MTEAPVAYCPACRSAQPHLYVKQDGTIGNRFTSDRVEWYVCHHCEETVTTAGIAAYFQQFGGELDSVEIEAPLSAAWTPHA